MPWQVRFYKWDGRRKREKVYLQKTVDFPGLADVLGWVQATLAQSSPDYISQTTAVRIAAAQLPVTARLQVAS